MKNKNFFLLFILLSYNTFLFAQNKTIKPKEGSCKAVIYSLQELYGNDSIAFEVFKTDYEITNMPNVEQDSLLKKNYVEVIRYFNSERGEKSFCRSRIIEIHPIDYQMNYILLNNKS